MQLEALGWDSFFASQLDRINDASLRPARVAVEHRGRYQLIGSEGPLWATPAGRLLHEARSRLDLPAVGDWVAVRDGVIHCVLVRKTQLVREAAGGGAEPQVIVANLDVVFVVAALNRELNPRRIERYLAAVWESGAEPVIVLNKADLADLDGRPHLGALAAGVPTLATSAVNGRGVAEIRARLGSGRTGALVGSSGVGKSTLANTLVGRDALEVGEVRGADDKGRHTTTRRELITLPDDRGVLIDTPGLRELALWSDAESGAGAGFAAIEALAAACRFGDCSHVHEPECAVRGAVAPEELASYHKLQRELAHQRRKQELRDRKERKVIHKVARKRRDR